MRILLKPISHEEVGEILVEDDLFPIGRREAPFSGMQGGSQLSRRHARLFTEGGVAYVVDLGSTNGTQLNGTRLGADPVRIQDGDEIIFGGEISFRAEIDDEVEDATVVAGADGLRLILTPEDSGLEPLVIQNFPFLITRNDDWIQKHQDGFADDIREISRRHAIIVAKGSRIYVEDLGSANGTFVGGERLDELARALNDGDVLRFGTSRFSYRAQIQNLDMDRTVVAAGADPDATQVASEPEQAAAESAERRQPPTAPEREPEEHSEPAPRSESPPPSAPPAPSESLPPEVSAALEDPKTIYLNSNPTSFVHEVFSHREQEQAAEPDAGQTPAAGKPAPVGRVAKARAVSRELGEALDTGPRLGRRLGIGALVLVLGVVVIVAGNRWLSADRRAVEALLESGDYAASAAAANAYLEDRPDEEVAAWGTEALIRSVLPEWLRQIEQAEFAAAGAWVRQSADEYPNIDDGVALLGLLEWATGLQAFVHERNRGEMSLFEAEGTVRDIVQSWEADSFTNSRLIGQLSDLAPEFQRTEAELMSSLRKLQNESSTSVEAIRALQTAVQAGLDDEDVVRVRGLIREFEARYPDVTGTESLQADLDAYERLKALVDARDLLSISELDPAEAFETPLFAGYVNRWLDRMMPDRSVIAAFEAANEQWRQGELEAALLAYGELTESDWGDVAQAELERMRSVMSDYRALERMRGQDGYGETLLTFRQDLIPGRDDYFLAALTSDLGAQEETLRARLEEEAAVARDEWRAFLEAGGIPGALRLQKAVSEQYSQQAARLGAAQGAVLRATDGYSLIQSEVPADWLSLRREIGNEVARQHRAMEDLKRVMDPGLIDSKLQLLPEIKED